MLNKKPLISIIIPAYNRGQFIAEAIQSALNQDYPNFEIIVSDNHSTDNTKDVVNKFKFDERVKYYFNELNIGLVGNFKIATEERAKGEYISYICSDDFYSNNHFISHAVGLVEKYPDVLLVAAKNSTLFASTNEIQPDKRDIIFQKEFMYGKELFKEFPQWSFPGWGGVLINREKLIETKAFDSKAQSLDYEANLKLMLMGNVAIIKEPCYVWRMHASQASGSMNMEAQISNLEFIENTCTFAKAMNVAIDIDKWREEAYLSYLGGVARRLINNKSEMVKLISYLKREKKISVNFFKTPKIFLLLTLYKNYNILSPVLKIIYPSLYRAIEKDK